MLEESWAAKRLCVTISPGNRFWNPFLLPALIWMMLMWLLNIWMSVSVYHKVWGKQAFEGALSSSRFPRVKDIRTGLKDL